jgi:hypothetical protein
LAGRLRYIGTTVALVFIGYIVWRSLDEMPNVDLYSPKALGQIAVALLAYAASQFIGAFAWRGLLGVWSVSLPLGRAESQHLVSQIGKYLPGNVGQFVGRFALARQDGVPTPIIGLAILFEIGLLIGTAVFLVASALAFLPDLASALLASDMVTDVGQHFWIVPAIAAVVVLGAGYILFREARRRNLPAARPLRIVLPVLFFFVNFVALGVSLSFVAAAVAPETGVSLGFATIIFAVAWVAGFVIPGAPGGVGIRDGIIAVGLGLAIGQGLGLAVALVHRGVSVVGDVLIFAFAGTMRWMVRHRA